MRKLFKSGLTAAALAAIMGIGTAASADIIFTEIADPQNDFSARFVEIFNSGPTDVDLSGWTLERFVNANTSGQGVADLSSIGTLTCGSFAIIANNQTTWETDFSQPPADLYDTTVAGNGDDTYVLRNSGATIVDIYGEIGTDGSGETWEYLDGGAERVSSSTSAASTFNQADWNSRAGSANQFPADYNPGSWTGSASCGGGGVNITLDGIIDEADYTLLGTYTSAHGFGDHGLVSLSAAVDSTNLYIGVTGESEDNFNAFVVFVDHNGTTGAPAGVALPGVDSGGGDIHNITTLTVLDMELDLMLRLATGGGAGNNFANIADFSVSPGDEEFLGSINDDGTSASLSTTGNTTGAPYNIAMALQDQAGDSVAAVVNEGWEIAIPLSTFPNVKDAASTDQFRIMAAYIGGDSWSSDIIPDPGTGTNNGVDPDLTDLAGRQWAAFQNNALGVVAQPAIALSHTSGTLGNEMFVSFSAPPTIPVDAADITLNDSAAVAATAVTDLGGDSYLFTLDVNGSGDLTSDTLTYDNGNDDAATDSVFTGIVSLQDIRNAVLGTANFSGSDAGLDGAAMTVRAVVIENVLDTFGADNITAQSGAFGIALRDASGFDLPAAVAIGDDVIFTGDYGEFGALSQLVAGGGLLSIQGNVAKALPAANAIVSPATPAQAEAAESTRVDLSGVTYADAGTTVPDIGGSGLDADLDDPTINARLDRDVETEFEGLQFPTGAVTVSGIMGQFTFSSPANSGYQLFPLTAGDGAFVTSVNDWMLLDQ